MKSYGGDNGRCIVKVRRKTFTDFTTPAKTPSEDSKETTGKKSSVNQTLSEKATPKTPLADGNLEVYWDDDLCRLVTRKIGGESLILTSISTSLPLDNYDDDDDDEDEDEVVEEYKIVKRGAVRFQEEEEEDEDSDVEQNSEKPEVDSTITNAENHPPSPTIQTSTENIIDSFTSTSSKKKAPPSAKKVDLKTSTSPFFSDTTTTTSRKKSYAGSSKMRNRYSSVVDDFNVEVDMVSSKLVAKREEKLKLEMKEKEIKERENRRQTPRRGKKEEATATAPTDDTTDITATPTAKAPKAKTPKSAKTTTPTTKKKSVPIPKPNVTPAPPPAVVDEPAPTSTHKKSKKGYGKKKTIAQFFSTKSTSKTSSPSKSETSETSTPSISSLLSPAQKKPLSRSLRACSVTSDDENDEVLSDHELTSSSPPTAAISPNVSEDEFLTNSVTPAVSVSFPKKRKGYGKPGYGKPSTDTTSRTSMHFSKKKKKSFFSTTETNLSATSAAAIATPASEGGGKKKKVLKKRKSAAMDELEKQRAYFARLDQQELTLE
ncbi:hypothetical protein TrLO_g6917 [Triparma laevis f. longispina]|uniref:Uncharacterized protein n=1 Tax=Triparma laevis f. longispina TaxID=1714387 RepID=A0A9W7C6P2_9STRA|nr:hypothetical protein TrLO_g6917 [Triparma laevis f. longispina]